MVIRNESRALEMNNLERGGTTIIETESLNTNMTKSQDTITASERVHELRVNVCEGCTKV